MARDVSAATAMQFNIGIGAPPSTLSPSYSQQPLTDLLTSVLDERNNEQEDDSAFDYDSDARAPWRIGLFWYTFGLLALLLLISALTGYLLLRFLDDKSRLYDNTRQIVSTAILARSALPYLAPDQRTLLVQTLMQQDRVRIFPRVATDSAEPFNGSDRERLLIAMLRDRMGLDTIVARSVNGQPGLWVSFVAGGNNWWLWFDSLRADQGMSDVWLLWLAALAALMLVSAALFARLVNRPLDALADAAMRVRKGDYASPLLDETVHQTEVRAVNVRFNRMADQLVRVEQDRAQMLAGISHDLRTPLARLRLEVEMGVPDEETRDRMAVDIGQVSATLNKFLDYARPGHGELGPIDLYRLVRRCARGFASRKNMSVQVDMPTHLYVQSDEIDLARVITNLLENANHYGQTPGTGFTRVRIAAAVKNDNWVRLRVRDYGPGVPAEQIGQLTRPFYRGDVARKNATGTGLGLTIVARMIETMGGQFRLVNAGSGGLMALIHLQRSDGMDKDNDKNKDEDYL